MYFGFSKRETKINIQCPAVEYPVENKKRKKYWAKIVVFNALAKSPDRVIIITNFLDGIKLHSTLAKGCQLCY